MDMKNLGAKRVMVVTDSTVLKLAAMQQVREGLEKEGVEYEVYSNVRVEPKDSSYVALSSFHCACSGILTVNAASKRPLPLRNHMRLMPSSLSAVDQSSTPPS